jgi:hypothetical protein
LPPDCRLDPLFVKIIAQRAFTRLAHRVITSSEPFRDKPVAC